MHSKEEFSYSAETGMRIFIKSLNGNSITVDIKPTDTVKKLKSKVFDRLQVPPDNQRLLYGTTQLEDKKTLSDYEIEDKFTIHFVVRVPGGVFNVLNY